MFRILIWIVILTYFAFFVVFNVDPKVKVHLLPGIILEDIPLALVIVFSFILGLLLGLLIVYTKLFRAQLRIYQLEKQVKEAERMSERGERESEKDRTAL